ncbi:helix-turn-helix domain-containing protein [Crateriforma conspicua]|uniref:DnaD N-terminal domain-containing protein n=1 Tax=Crateriforma conspicua TaxID=2527996 RepID=A0A5C6FI10_9PLAN|nr:helix-turn-helix domain-containing protein [Crateriforma conspicua]TWU59631.1 hypothetical protein V7x_55410 [Crateriforma conspicua]
MPAHTKKKKPAGEPELKKRWSPEVIELGWVGVPWLVVEKQAELGLSCPDLALLLHLWKHWWKKENLPFPSHASIAAAMGKTVNHVQKMTKKLEANGVIVIHHRTNKHGGQTSNEYSFEPLIEKLQTLAAAERDRRRDETSHRQQPTRRKTRRKASPRTRLRVHAEE